MRESVQRNAWRLALPAIAVVFALAIVVPVVLTIVAWPLSVDANDFISRTVPYLGEARDYYNSSIAGNGASLRDIRRRMAPMLSRKSNALTLHCITNTRASTTIDGWTSS